ncbi:MAG: hypothetical protein WC356_00470 [Candidatus Micrarchaeia archaeon]|jgi:AbrB family looped-hinge helix DNA binding protein
MEVREIHANGLVVIPAFIRRMFGLSKGSKVVFKIEEDRVYIEKETDVVKEMEKFAEEANVSEKEIKKLIKTAREEGITKKMQRCNIDVS